MSVNSVILSGTVSQYGPKISWADSGKAQTFFALMIEEPRKDGASFKTFAPVLIVGPQAEMLAESLDPGDTVLYEGKLMYWAGKMREGGKLVVVTYAVEVLVKARVEGDRDGTRQGVTNGGRWNSYSQAC